MNCCNMSNDKKFFELLNQDVSLYKGYILFINNLFFILFSTECRTVFNGYSSVEYSTIYQNVFIDSLT